MTIVLLASICLFALVVAGRPVPSDSEPDLSPTPSTLQITIQSAFQVHAGKDDLASDAWGLQASVPKKQSKFNAENIAATTSFETSLGYGTSHHTDQPIASELVVEGQNPTDRPESHAAPLIILAFSCLAAFLALVCITLTLYVIRILRSPMFTSKTAWELLSRIWRRPKFIQKNTHTSTREHSLRTGAGQDRLPDTGFADKNDLHVEDKLNAVSDMDSEIDDIDGKYQDALDMTPFPFTHDFSLEERHPTFDDPPLPSLETRPFDRGTLMRESCPSPVLRPAWSVRATDSPALGLTAREAGSIDSSPLPLIHPRRRAYRSAVPEVDIALAMQLRPGLGIGADSAWMVRFLMAIFGWFAVALTGNTS